MRTAEIRAAPPQPAVASYVETQPGVKPEAAHPLEAARLRGDWQKAINFVFSQNAALMDRDYAKKEALIEEFKRGGKDVTNAEVNKEIDKEFADRTLEQQAAQTLDLDKIAQQMNLDLTKDEEKAKAEEEKKRREHLIEASNILYTVSDAMKATESPAAQKLIEDAIKKELDRINAERKAKTPPEQELTDLSDEQKVKITAEVIRQNYYDEESGVFHRVNPDGTPITDQSVQHSDSYKIVNKELERIKKPDTPNITPEKKAEAEKILTALNYNESQNKFRVKSEREKEAELAEKDHDRVVKEGIIFWGEQIRDSLGSDSQGVEIFDKLFEVDTAGKITGLKQGVNLDQVLKEISNNLENIPDKVRETIGRLTLYCGAYYDTSIDPKFKPRLAAVVYDVLKNTLPSDRASLLDRSLNNAKRYDKIWAEITEEFAKEHNVVLPASSRKNIFRNLTYALVFREKLKGKITVDEQRQLHLPTDAVNTKSDWWKEWTANFTGAEKQFVLDLAVSEGSVESIMTNVFGLSSETLTDTNVREQYVENILKNLIPEISSTKDKATRDAISRVYKEVALYSVSNETLEKMAAKRGLPRTIGMGLLLLMIAAPSLQGLLNEGIVGDKDER